MRALLLAAMLLAPLVLPSAGAECERNIHVASRRPLPVGLFNAPDGGVTHGTCVVLLDATYRDDRYLFPNATEVLVRYLADLGPSNATLNATLDGLGFADASLLLVRTPTLPPPGAPREWTYRAEWVAIPDLNATGLLNVTVELPAGGSVSKSYSTFP